MVKHGCEGQISIYDICEKSMDMKRDLYVLVENNIYELPICVCDSIEELADFTGDSVERIHDLMTKAEKRQGKSKYIKVTINDED